MKKRVHQPLGNFVGYVYCVKCGLLYLNNRASRKEAGKPCPGAEKEDNVK